MHQWVNVFTRAEYIEIILESLRYCQAVMTNHVHLIVSSKAGKLSDTIRDFKKFTASKVVKAINENEKESRKSWLLWLLKKDEHVLFWTAGYHGEVIFTKEFYDSKANYIHQNPVRAGVVEKEEEYLYSSCGQLYGVRKGPLDLAEY